MAANVSSLSFLSCVDTVSVLDHIDDERRELSAKGARQATGLGQFLRNGGVRFDAAYSSPLIRARQTAGLILDETNKGSHLEFQLAGALVNATPVEDFVGWLKSWPPVEHLLLVGHEPTMSLRVAALLGVQGPYGIEMKKAACCCLTSRNLEHATLKFHVTPECLGIS